MEKREPSLHCWWECNLVQPLWKTVWRFLKKLQIELPYYPEIPLLGMHIKETRIERDTGTPLFIAALFTIARTWKLEKEMATHSSILAWRIPRTEEGGVLLSMGSHRVRHK